MKGLIALRLGKLLPTYVMEWSEASLSLFCLVLLGFCRRGSDTTRLGNLDGACHPLAGIKGRRQNDRSPAVHPDLDEVNQGLSWVLQPEFSSWDALQRPVLEQELERSLGLASTTPPTGTDEGSPSVEILPRSEYSTPPLKRYRLVRLGAAASLSNTPARESVFKFSRLLSLIQVKQPF